MTMFNPDVFRAYDIRGIYGVDFDTKFARRLGNRLTSYVGAGVFVVGRDARESSEELARAVIDGAVHVGATVLDVGVVSSPQCFWAIRERDAAGGVMVTASHNPDAYNGFKVVGIDGEVLGGHHIRQIYDSQPCRHCSDGTVRCEDVIPGYAEAVAKAADWRGQELQIAIDAPLAVQRALELIAPIAPDHDLAARFDADGDRIVLYENGIPISADALLPLIVERLGLKAVAFDLLFSRAVREHMERLSVSYAVTKVGHPDIIKNMRRIGAQLGAEVSGHYYWEQFGRVESPELMLLHVMRMVRESGEKLSKLAVRYTRYVKGEIVGVPIGNRKSVDAVIARLKEKYHDGRISQVDGISVDYDDWWFNVRPSNTEPVLRFVVEAKNKDLLDQKIAEVRLALASCQH